MPLLFVKEMLPRFQSAILGLFKESKMSSSNYFTQSASFLTGGGGGSSGTALLSRFSKRPKRVATSTKTTFCLPFYNLLIFPEIDPHQFYALFLRCTAYLVIFCRLHRCMAFKPSGGCERVIGENFVISKFRDIPTLTQTYTGLLADPQKHY
jgi:hypothetical protein